MGMSTDLSRRSELDHQRSAQGDDPKPLEEPADSKSPERSAFVTFLAFVIAGLGTLASNIIELGSTFPHHCVYRDRVFCSRGESKSGDATTLKRGRYRDVRRRHGRRRRGHRRGSPRRSRTRTISRGLRDVRRLDSTVGRQSFLRTHTSVWVYRPSSSPHRLCSR